MTTVRQSELKVSITLQQNATRHPSPRSWEAEFSECCSPHTRHQAAPARRTALALRHATRHPGMSASRLERPDLSRDPRAVVRSPQRSTAAVCAGGHVPPAAHRARPGPARTRCAPIGLPPGPGRCSRCPVPQSSPCRAPGPSASLPRGPRGESDLSGIRITWAEPGAASGPRTPRRGCVARAPEPPGPARRLGPSLAHGGGLRGASSTRAEGLPYSRPPR